MILSRRTVLRGLVQGAAITVPLPFLDCFLNSSGTALASGASLPVRFGTWFWGCGVNQNRWQPAKLGAGYDLKPELQAIQKYQDKVSILSGFRAMLDGRPNFPHISGNIALRTGVAPKKEDEVEAPTLDLLVADHIGNRTRFPSIDIAATGNPKHNYSIRSAAATKTSDVSPVSLYSRIFGAEFRDPNSGDFKPDPKIMAERSVLSTISEDRRRLERIVGASDQARLDEYFTSVRQLEKQLSLQLEKPLPRDACLRPASVQEASLVPEIESVISNHKTMARLLALALACDQTRVFNMVFSDSLSSLRRAGISTFHHQLTHEEPVDASLGYQPQATYFVERSMEAWAVFLESLEEIREGAGTLLDNTLVLAHSDTNYAKVHSVEGLPVMLAGAAGGRVRPGIHVNGNGDPVTRAGLSILQAMGVARATWGVGAQETNKPIGEILT